MQQTLNVCGRRHCFMRCFLDDIKQATHLPCSSLTAVAAASGGPGCGFEGRADRAVGGRRETGEKKENTGGKGSSSCWPGEVKGRDRGGLSLSRSRSHSLSLSVVLGWVWLSVHLSALLVFSQWEAKCMCSSALCTPCNIVCLCSVSHRERERER